MEVKNFVSVALKKKARSSACIFFTNILAQNPSIFPDLETFIDKKSKSLHEFNSTCIPQFESYLKPSFKLKAIESIAPIISGEILFLFYLKHLRINLKMNKKVVSLLI